MNWRADSLRPSEAPESKPMQHTTRQQRGRHFIGIGVCAAVVIGAGDRVATAEESPPSILRVEIDWEILLYTPDATASTPELSFVISPFETTETVYSMFTVNYRDDSGYQAGGFQNQVWASGTLVRTKSSASTAVLNTPGELIRFTQVMQANPGNYKLDFDVVNLESCTWGNLSGSFANTYRESGLTDLSQFSVTTTINETGVQAGGSRVDHVMLRRVRQYSQSGLYSDVGYYQKIYEGVTSVVQSVETVNAVGQFVPQ